MLSRRSAQTSSAPPSRVEPATPNFPCPLCGAPSKCHAQQLSHIADCHPASIDATPMGRLGSILMYQRSGKLFHCSLCFHTSRDFNQIYLHVLAKHCLQQSEPDKEEEPEKEVEKAKEEVKVKEEDMKEEQKNLLALGGQGFRCLICNWRHRWKSVIVSHVVRIHNIPKICAWEAIRLEAEEELEENVLKDELEATAKVVTFVSKRFVCRFCGWKTKNRGLCISHVVRRHDVERPYKCKQCGRSFFLPSRLNHHVKSAHRPGCYACPFCYFRSQQLCGFRRHCGRCDWRNGAGGERDEDDEEEEEE